MLSKQDREAILNKENINQKRCLRIKINEQVMIKPRQLGFCMQLASEFEIVIAYLSSNNHVFIIESILDKLMSESKPINLHIHVKKDFKVDHFKEIFNNQFPELTPKSIKFSFMLKEMNA